ncbi:MAG: TetR/AcrR family transcriptional regulator [Propionibacteriaceae bacterium]|jgi:AcrR family transcriptional regulator|nr:TetR/AcrR family transcriptional regulator [Propionibacteriaceae bacterium]
MTSTQRREQLIRVARSVFADHGFDGTSVEEIASKAKVSKPVVYEHFGGKEGLYAVVVDREVRALDEAIQAAIRTPDASYREIIERGSFALMDYIDSCPEGFRIISRDSAVGSASGSFASILNDIAASVEEMLRVGIKGHGFDPHLAGAWAQALTGLVANAGQYWLEKRKPNKEELVRQLVNLAWNGLATLETHPELLTKPSRDGRERIAPTRRPLQEK